MMPLPELKGGTPMERSNNTAVTYDSDMQSADLDHLELDSAQRKSVFYV